MTDRQEMLAQLEVQAKERFLQLQSAEEIKHFLKEKGAYQRDVDRIYREVKREVQKSYTHQAEEQLLGGRPPQQIREEFQDQLPPAIMEAVLSSADQLARRKVQSQVHQMVDRGNSWEDVVRRFSDLPFIQKTDLAGWADRRHAQNQEEVAVKDKQGRGLVIGIVVLLLGLGLSAESYFSASKTGGTYTIWYGLIIGGVVLIGQGIWARRS